MLGAMRELVAGRIRVQEHPVRMGGAAFLTRMTVLTLADGGLVLHSPIPIDDALRAEIAAAGEVRAILAPSTFHHLFVADAQRAFPGVPTYAVVGLAEKRPDLELLPLPPDLWSGELDRVTIGNRVMREVVLYDRASRTVIAVDLVEHFRDETPGTNWLLRTSFKLFGMWNKPRPAPELRLLTRDRAAAKSALEQILDWDFDRMVFAHGELLETGGKEALREAWRFVLGR
jgi:hypothetical protein